MDLFSAAQLIPIAAEQLGLAPSTLVFYLGLGVMISKLLSRLIPDDSTGVLKVVHTIAQFLAFDVSNRITRGVSQAHVAKQIIGGQVGAGVHDRVRDLAEEPEALITEVVHDMGALHPDPNK